MSDSSGEFRTGAVPPVNSAPSRLAQLLRPVATKQQQHAAAAAEEARELAITAAAEPPGASGSGLL